MEPFTLRAGSLLLDQPLAADIDAIARYCQDPVFERFMTLPWPYARKDAEFFVHEYVPGGWSRGDEVTWAIRESGALIGVVGLREQSAMIGFWLGAEHRGRGHMPRAVTAVLDWVFAGGWLNTVRWEAVEGNTASLAVARKTGFRYTGVRPALVTARDGTSPPSWQAELAASDTRNPQPGWPNEDEGDRSPW